MAIASAEDIGRFLEDLARRKATTTYGHVVERFGLPPMEGAWAAHPLSAAFEYLDRQDAAASRPFRTAVVVRKDSNVPGNGFFESIARLKENGGVPASTDRAKEKVWVEELNAAYAYTWPVR